MKARINRTYVIILGVIVAVSLLAANFNQTNTVASTKTEEDILAKYKSTVPLVTTPLQILAKGLNIINK